MNNKFYLSLILVLTLCSCAIVRLGNNKQAFIPNQARVDNVNIALVLGAGGARGVAHAGVISELAKENIQPDLIVGSSIGALIGALYADNADIDQVCSVAIKTKMNDMINFNVASFPISLGDGKNLQNYLEQNIKSRTFEDLSIPLVVVATNLQFGVLTPFSAGPLLPALKASAAYPGMYFPVKIKNQYFVDGGVLSSVPVLVAKKYKPKIIIGVDIGEPLKKTSPKNAFGLIKPCF